MFLRPRLRFSALPIRLKMPRLHRQRRDPRAGARARLDPVVARALVAVEARAHALVACGCVGAARAPPRTPARRGGPARAAVTAGSRHEGDKAKVIGRSRSGAGRCPVRLLRIEGCPHHRGAADEGGCHEHDDERPDRCRSRPPRPRTRPLRPRRSAVAGGRSARREPSSPRRIDPAA